MKIIRNADGTGWPYEVHPYIAPFEKVLPFTQGIEVDPALEAPIRYNGRQLTVETVTQLIAGLQKAVELAHWPASAKPLVITDDDLRQPTRGLENKTESELCEYAIKIYEASSSVRAMAWCIGVELGTQISADYGPKYFFSPDDDSPNDKPYTSRKGLVIYIDDYGHFMDVSIDGKIVCGTHRCTQKFISGEWVKRIDTLYPKAKAKQEKREHEKAEAKRQKLIRALS